MNYRHIAAPAFSLMDNPASSDDVLANNLHFSDWQHSIHHQKGCWEGNGSIQMKNDAALENFFLNNLGYRVAVGSGGITWWIGQIVRMEYTKKGQTFTRSMEEMANRINVLYTKTGPNLLRNGNVEDGAWSSVGSPSTIETTTDWWARGSTAMHVVSASAGDGAEIEDSSSGASSWTIDASTEYTCSIIVKVESGTWSLTVYQSDGATELASRDTSGTGRSWVECRIPDSNEYSGSIIVQLTADDGSREIYADGASFRLTGKAAETGWTEDDDSIAEYGNIEAIFLEKEMTDSEADAKAAREIAARAWPSTEGPDSGTLVARGRDEPSQLVAYCVGPTYSMSWEHTLIDGTEYASTHIASLVDEAQFFSSSSDAIIETNTNEEIFIDTSRPTTIWKAIEKVFDAGNDGGEMMGGGYPVAEFRYESRPDSSEVVYQIRDGELQYYGGGAVHPLEAAPGWCLNLDMPQEPTPAGASADFDPRLMWLEEMIFSYREDETMTGGVCELSWRRERRDL